MKSAPDIKCFLSIRRGKSHFGEGDETFHGKIMYFESTSNFAQIHTVTNTLLLKRYLILQSKQDDTTMLQFY